MSSAPQRIKRSILKESISASDYLKYKIPLSCEDCTHFSFTHQKCTLGNETKAHRKDVQTQSYIQSGRVAFCRLLEID